MRPNTLVIAPDWMTRSTRRKPKKYFPSLPPSLQRLYNDEHETYFSWDVRQDLSRREKRLQAIPRWNKVAILYGKFLYGKDGPPFSPSVSTLFFRFQYFRDCSEPHITSDNCPISQSHTISHIFTKFRAIICTNQDSNKW